MVKISGLRKNLKNEIQIGVKPLLILIEKVYKINDLIICFDYIFYINYRNIFIIKLKIIHF